jgi:hypothetical protein
MHGSRRSYCLHETQAITRKHPIVAVEYSQTKSIKTFSFVIDKVVFLDSPFS